MKQRESPLKRTNPSGQQVWVARYTDRNGDRRSADDADLAQVAGHTVETMLGTYTHALGRSHQQIRELVG